MSSKSNVNSVNPETWQRKVYDTISESGLWVKKLSYEEYLKKTDEYSKKYSTFPSEQDLLDPPNFTRGIFIAINKYIVYVRGFDYEDGYDALFETLSELFQKATIPFSWERANDSLYRYRVDGSKYELGLSSKDEDEVEGDALLEIEVNINKALKKRGLYIIHTHTGDQTADYVLAKTDSTDKLKEIFPNSEDLQFFVDSKKVKNRKSIDQGIDEEFRQYKQGSYFNKLKIRWKILSYIHNPITKVFFLFFGESETSK